MPRDLELERESWTPLTPAKDLPTWTTLTPAKDLDTHKSWLHEDDTARQSFNKMEEGPSLHEDDTIRQSFGKMREGPDDLRSFGKMEEGPDDIRSFGKMQEGPDDIEFVDHTPEILKELHPYAQVLGITDLESCVALEEAAFPPEHRCTREKFIYRLSKASSLTLGLFSSSNPAASQPEKIDKAPTASTANAPDSNEPERKGILLAHIIATQTTNDAIHDDDMALPPNWRVDAQAHPHLGHKDHGRNLAIHSLAVLPQYQRKGLGKILMKAYIQRIVEANVADMISIITYEKLVPYYEELGFMNEGPSKAAFGGGGWVDMVLDFKDFPSDSEEGELMEEEVEVEV